MINPLARFLGAKFQQEVVLGSSCSADEADVERDAKWQTDIDSLPGLLSGRRDRLVVGLGLVRGSGGLRRPRTYRLCGCRVTLSSGSWGGGVADLAGLLTC